MCQFITLVAETSDIDRLGLVTGRHGRRPLLVDNPTVRALLHQGEHQYLLRHQRGCDCGTVLGHANAAEEAAEARRVKESTRMRRLGWSDSKIVRALAGQADAERRRRSHAIDSLALWEGLLAGLGRELGLRRAALLVHDYRYSVDTDDFAVHRTDALGLPLEAGLAALAYDEITDFALDSACL